MVQAMQKTRQMNDRSAEKMTQSLMSLAVESFLFLMVQSCSVKALKAKKAPNLSVDGQEDARNTCGWRAVIDGLQTPSWLMLLGGGALREGVRSGAGLLVLL